MRSLPPPPAPPANTNFGDYTLVERIAVGGMAEVFLALEPRPVGEPRSVVLKRMLPAIAAEAGSREMFEAEARIGETVHHPNVVEVLGYGVHDEHPYLVLEYIKGVDLWQMMRWLTRGGETVRPELALHILQKVLDALVAVHTAKDSEGDELQIVHRDVSPSNVLLSVYGEVKIGDFGIAWSQLRDNLNQPVPGERAKGKLGYLSPEQVKGEPCDQRADVFSVGVIAAELLMGRPLFSGGSELAVLLAIRDAKIHPFKEAIPRLPDGLGDIVIKALSADPAERPDSALQLLQELQVFQTETESELREELAALVQKAFPGVASSPHIKPRVDDPDRVTAVDLSVEDRHTPFNPAEVEAHKNTTGPPAAAADGTIQLFLRAQDSSDEEGPFSYAQVVERITTGQVSPETLVSRGGGAFIPLENDTELRRHFGNAATSFTPTTRQHQTPRDPDEQIDLAGGGIIGALAWSVLNKDSGFWLCEFGGVRKEIYFTDGMPRFVTSNLAGELLGEYLVSRGVISRSELDMALAVMPRFEGRLGDTLTALGLVEPVNLFQIIAAQVRDKLLDLFMWTGGSASLYRGVAPPDAAFPLKIDPWRIIEEGVRRRVEEGLESASLNRHALQALVRADDVSVEVQRAPLPPDARLLLNTLIKPRAYTDLEGMLPDLPGRKNRVERAVVLLLHLKAVEWVK